MPTVTEQQAVQATSGVQKALSNSLSKGNAPAPLAAPSAGLVGGTLGAISGVFNFAVMWKMMSVVPNTIANGLDYPAKNRYIGAPFRFLSSALRAPGKILNDHTVMSWTNSMEGQAAAAAKKASEFKPLNQFSNYLNVDEAGKTAFKTPISRTAFKTSKSILTTLGNYVEKGLAKVGLLDKWRKSGAHLEGKAATSFKEAHTSLTSALNELKGDEFKDARAVLETAQDKLRTLRNASPTLIADTTQKVGEAFKVVEENKGITDATKQALKAANKNIATFAQKTLNTHNYFNAAELRRDFGLGLSKVPSRIARMNVGEAAFSGLYYTGQAMTAYDTAKLFTGGMGTLKHMYQSITGEKPSTFTILFGKMPEAMKEVRKQYWLSTLPQAGANIAGMAIWRMMIKSGGNSFKTAVPGMFAQIAAGSVGSFFAEQNNLFSAYRKIAMEQAQGAEIPAGAYIGLLVHASPAARKLSASSPDILEGVAQQYAKEQIPAGLVLREMDKGTLNERIAAVKVQKAHAIQSEKENAADKTMRAPVQLGNTTITSKVAPGGFAENIKAAQGVSDVVAQATR